MSEPVSLVVARARLVGGVELTPEAPDEVEGAKGASLIVKLPYHYEEVSRKKDDFRVLLDASLEGDHQSPAIFEHNDRLGVADDQRGFVSQEFRLQEPGEYTLQFRAEAAWRDDGVKTSKEVEGSVRIKVLAADSW